VHNTDLYRPPFTTSMSRRGLGMSTDCSPLPHTFLLQVDDKRSYKIASESHINCLKGVRKKMKHFYNPDGLLETFHSKPRFAGVVCSGNVLMLC
jgi:hypothetical protein